MFFHTPDETTPDIEMDETAVDEFLERRGWGCLTLAKDDVAYSIPVSFGYDGDSTLYFQLQTDEDSTKLTYLDATTTATFLVPEVRPPDWTSVIARGEIRRISDADTDDAYAAFGDNAWFPLVPWTDDRTPIELELYELELDKVVGRSSTAWE